MGDEMIIKILLIYGLIQAVGMALSYGIFYKKLNLFEHLIFGFTLGLIVPNVIYASIWLVSGLQFSLYTWLVTNAVIFVLGVSAIIYRYFKNKIPKQEPPVSEAVS
jgi:hypothetical protein